MQPWQADLTSFDGPTSAFSNDRFRCAAMAVRGQRFELDLDAEEFVTKPLVEAQNGDKDTQFSIGEIKERDSIDAEPAAPTLKASHSGFPAHKKRRNPSTFKQRQYADFQADTSTASPISLNARTRGTTQLPPSDKAILHHIGKKYGHDFETQQKAEISDENKKKISEMSNADIEEARAELMANLNPALIARLLKRAKIDDDNSGFDDELQETNRNQESEHPELDNANILNKNENEDQPRQMDDPIAQNTSGIHFPTPPRLASSFVPLDPSDPNFLVDLKKHYFPETPHDPSSLSWLQEVTPEEAEDSPYNPSREAYSTSSLRFSFKGTLIPPKQSLDIDVSKGLHHHGEAPSSAGYTIPELALLARSTLANQRCVAYQVLGRILFRLGRGDFGPRGSELQEGLWSLIEHERTVEIMMGEANQKAGHVSAKAYATEALWLWRKGGGGDRGLLKPGERIAK